MRQRWFAFILVLMPALSLPQNPSASLEGTVVDRVTSQGIAGVDLVLTGIVQGRVVNVAGKTTAGGLFRFEKVSPSDYWMRASHGEDHVETVYRQRGLYGTGEQMPGNRLQVFGWRWYQPGRSPGASLVQMENRFRALGCRRSAPTIVRAWGPSDSLSARP